MDSLLPVADANPGTQREIQTRNRLFGYNELKDFKAILNVVLGIFAAISTIVGVIINVGDVRVKQFKVAVFTTYASLEQQLLVSRFQQRPLIVLLYFCMVNIW